MTRAGRIEGYQRKPSAGSFMPQPSPRQETFSVAMTPATIGNAIFAVTGSGAREQR
jgi:hypothetical protein